MHKCRYDTGNTKAMYSTQGHLALMTRKPAFRTCSGATDGPHACHTEEEKRCFVNFPKEHRRLFNSWLNFVEKNKGS